MLALAGKSNCWVCEDGFVADLQLPNATKLKKKKSLKLKMD